MSSDEDVLIQALEKRLANLEAIVLGSDPVFAARLSKLSRQKGMDVSTRVAQVLKEWDLKQQEWAKDGHASTQAAYEAIEKEVTETEDFSLDRSSKVDIILETSEATLSLADKARTFSTHTQYVNSEAVGKVGELNKDIAPLSTVHWEQVETASQINTLYHEIMESYNETVQLLSKKFVFWDSLLKLAEQEAARKAAS